MPRRDDAMMQTPAPGAAAPAARAAAVGGRSASSPWRRPARVGAALLVLALLLPGGRAGPASAEAVTAAAALRLGSLQAASLDELSGLAWSASGDGLWGHNDHGHGPWLHRIGPAGEDRGRLRLDNASHTDWEDLAWAEVDGRRLLLVGDVGDNLRRREQVQIHVLDAPPADADHATPRYSIALRYPGGPQDVEGIAWDPRDDHIYLLGKREVPPPLFRLPLAPSAGRPVVAERVGALELPPPPLSVLFSSPRRHLMYNLPTALAISADGLRMVVLTYGALYVYDRAADAGWKTVLHRRPVILRLPELPQAEALALSADGREATVGSEGRHSPLLRLTLPPWRPPEGR